MIRQHIYLPAYRWDILVFYWAEKDDAGEIVDAMRRLGAADGIIDSAEENILDSVQNTGLTYTNESERGTVMVIGQASSPEEFWNTLDHEKGHAVQHIGSALGMDHMGEPLQYLAGMLAMEMYPVARRFICDKC